MIVNVRAALEEVAAFFWDFDSRAYAEISGDDARRTVLKEPREFEKVVRRSQSVTAKHFRGGGYGEFVCKMAMHIISENKIVIIADAAEETEDSEECQQSRYFENFAFKLVRRPGDLETKVEFVTELGLSDEAGSSNSSKAEWQSLIEQRLHEITMVKLFFEYRVKAGDMTEKNGEILGHAMVWNGGQLRGGDKAVHVDEVLVKSRALNAIRAKYPWIAILIQRAREGAVAVNYPVSTALSSLNENDARIIGNNLMPALKRNKIVATGIDQWMRQNRAIDELFDELPWMKGLFLAVGQGVVNSAPWGLTWRVSVGAALSTVDLVTDIYITYTFWKDGRNMFFLYSVAMLGTSMFIMLFMVWVQNRKMGWKRVLVEMIPVFVGLKPTVDAFRVASGAKISKGQAVDPVMEMTCTKCAEMFAEAIPGVIIQLSAILSGDGGTSTGATVSLAVSALTTGFVSASLSYDWDTDPRGRSENPEFYGYILNSATPRTAVFIAMLLLSSAMLLVRTLILVLLGLASRSAAFLYIGIDMGLYLTYKVLRSDFYYWMPLEGSLEIIASLLCRIIVKVITDFTSNTQLRHPNEVGGAYWIFGLGFTLASLPLTIMYYQDIGDETIAEIAWDACSVLLICSLVFIVVFFMNIDKEYRGTFWSMAKTEDNTLKYFESSKDEVKALIFTMNCRHWKSIERNVEEWVFENWRRWMDEQPEWLDDNMKARIPPRMIPNITHREMVVELQSKRKRTSFMEKTGRIFRNTKINRVLPQPSK